MQFSSVHIYLILLKHAGKQNHMLENQKMGIQKIHINDKRKTELADSDKI